MLKVVKLFINIKELIYGNNKIIIKSRNTVKSANYHTNVAFIKKKFSYILL